jgi:uncharacterized membrane protein
MHNYEFGSTSGPGQYTDQTPGGAPRRYSVLSLIIIICGVAIVATLGLGLAFWVLGFLFHVAGLIVKVALITAAVAFVWRRVAHGRCRHRV